MHHAFVIEAEAEEGVEAAQAWAKKELGMMLEQNPDISILRYGLFSVADARKIAEVAAGAPFAGEYKVIIIAAVRAYHEAQNALLKVFEEPPAGTFIFLVLPTLGGLLPTLRSRVQVLPRDVQHRVLDISGEAQEFLRAGKEKRGALIKRLSSGKDDEERRERRQEAIALIDGIEATLVSQGLERHAATLSEIATFRSHLHERSAPVRMILEHLSLVLPGDFSRKM